MVTMTWPSATAKVLAIGRDRPANVDKRDQIAPAECVHSLAGVESVEARDDNVCFFQRSDRFRGWETLIDFVDHDVLVNLGGQAFGDPPLESAIDVARPGADVATEVGFLEQLIIDRNQRSRCLDASVAERRGSRRRRRRRAGKVLTRRRDVVHVDPTGDLCHSAILAAPSRIIIGTAHQLRHGRRPSAHLQRRIIRKDRLLADSRI